MLWFGRYTTGTRYLQLFKATDMRTHTYTYMCICIICIIYWKLNHDKTFCSLNSPNIICIFTRFLAGCQAYLVSLRFFTCLNTFIHTLQVLNSQFSMASAPWLLHHDMYSNSLLEMMCHSLKLWKSDLLNLLYLVRQLEPTCGVKAIVSSWSRW